MNFGSKFVYYYNKSDEESVSADSDSDDGSSFAHLDSDDEVQTAGWGPGPVASAGFMSSVKKGELFMS